MHCDKSHRGEHRRRERYEETRKCSTAEWYLTPKGMQGIYREESKVPALMTFLGRERVRYLLWRSWIMIFCGRSFETQGPRWSSTCRFWLTALLSPVPWHGSSPSWTTWWLSQRAQECSCGFSTPRPSWLRPIPIMPIIQLQYEFIGKFLFWEEK